MSSTYAYEIGQLVRNIHTGTVQRVTNAWTAEDGAEYVITSDEMLGVSFGPMRADNWTAVTEYVIRFETAPYDSEDFDADEWTPGILTYTDPLDAVRFCMLRYVNLRVLSVEPEPHWENYSSRRRPVFHGEG